MTEKPINNIEYSKKFLRALKKINSSIIQKVSTRERIFKNNAFDHRLRTHKLSGKDQNSWSFYVDYSIRIKFIFLSNKEVLFLDIGPHNIYK